MLFGHQDDATQHSAAQAAPGSGAPTPPAQTPGVNPLAVDPDTGASFPVVQQGTPGPAVPAQPPATDPVQDSPSVLDQPSAPGYGGSSFSNDPAPTSPFGADQTSQGAPSNTAQANPVAGAPTAHLTPAFSDESASVSHSPAPQAAQSFTDYTASNPDPATVSTHATDDLLSLKQQALSQLGPLVGQLDQSPEEKFRTTMMLIQSTDNPELLKEAYEAAQAISDEKARAQALLDIVNEINYFTQQSAAATPTTV